MEEQNNGTKRRIFHGLIPTKVRKIIQKKIGMKYFEPLGVEDIGLHERN